MELELGLKITKTRDDLTSTTNFRMAKGSSDPIFMATETETKFILTAHLKGFGREHIGIKINEDGTQIAIKWEKPVQEIVMSGWMVHKKEVELKRFIRVFQIPEGVVLDRIKAKFIEEESVLTILMPKSVKGIRGVGIEEVKEEVVNGVKNEIASTNDGHASVGKVEESGQTMRKKAEKERSMKETSAHEAKEKVIVRGRIKETNVKSRHEKRGVLGVDANRHGLKATRSEVGESSKEGDGIRRATKKCKEEVNVANKEETDSVDKEKADDEGKLEVTQLYTDHSRLSLKEDDKEAERNKEKTSPTQIAENDEATNQIYDEAATAEHKEVKPVRLDSPKMKEQIEKEKIPEENSNNNNNNNNSLPILQGSDTEDGTIRVEKELQEDLEEMEGLRKSQPDHVSNHPAAGHHDDKEACDGEENPEREDEIEEEGLKNRKEIHGQEQEDNENDSCNEEKELDTSGEVPQGRKKERHSSRKTKICTTCVVVSSSIVLSLVVFAIHWIRSKKRQAN